MTTKNRDRKRLALAIGAIVSTAPAMAFDFDIYEIDASLSTTLTAGIAYRLEDQDKDLISQATWARNSHSVTRAPRPTTSTTAT